MINSYKDLIEDQKGKNIKLIEDNKELNIDKINLQKDNDDLKNYIHILEERSSDNSFKFSSEIKKDKEEISR